MRFFLFRVYTRTLSVLLAAAAGALAWAWDAGRVPTDAFVLILLMLGGASVALQLLNQMTEDE